MYSEFSKEPVCFDEIKEVILVENTFIGVSPNGTLIHLARKYVPKVEIVQTTAPVTAQQPAKKRRGRRTSAEIQAAAVAAAVAAATQQANSQPQANNMQ